MVKSQTATTTVVGSVTAACARVLKSVKTVTLPGSGVPTRVAWIYKDPRKTYKFGAELGHGNYGVVHAVTHVQTGRVFACKILRKRVAGQQRHHLLTEVAALEQVSEHPNIASLHEVWEDEDYVYIFIEACLGGELFDAILQRGHFSERDAAVVMKVVLDVLQFCHAKGIVHRDLKPENFLLKRAALDASQPLRGEDLRAVDFGLATFVEPDQVLTELLGSPYYVAPELLQGHYSQAADVWSAGVILYILLSGAPPFTGRDEKEVFQHILRQPLDLVSEPWPHVSAGAKDLVRKLLDRDPAKRLTTEQALSHLWLSQGGSGALKSDLVLARLEAFSHLTRLQGLLMNIVARNVSSDGIETLRDTFNALDANGDGVLSFEELRQGLGEVSGGDDQGSSLAQELLGALDLSGDGALDYHEFLAAALDRQRMLTDHTIAEMFAYLDKNHDGLLSPQELSEALAESQIAVSGATLSRLMCEEQQPGAQQGEGPMLTKEGFVELLRGGLQNEVIQYSQLEVALEDMQHSFRMQNRFRQLALLVIAHTMPMAELAGLQELFEALDVDSNGSLTMEELRQGLRSIDKNLSEDEIENLLRFMDVDSSGTVDYHEFVVGVLEDKQLLTEAKLRAAFNYFDTDGNGLIDIKEVEKVIQDLGIKMKQSPVELVAMADANDDKVIDFLEFREIMLAAEPNIMISRQQSLIRGNTMPSPGLHATLQRMASSRSATHQEHGDSASVDSPNREAEGNAEPVHESRVKRIGKRLLHASSRLLRRERGTLEALPESLPQTVLHPSKSLSDSASSRIEADGTQPYLRSASWSVQGQQTRRGGNTVFAAFTEPAPPADEEPGGICSHGNGALEGILEGEEHGSVGSSKVHTPQASGVSSSGQLTTMLAFMEDQWSHTSLLAKRKDKATR